MPRRTDLHRILLLGSGPIVIGQACEFDYSGTQACKALRAEGFEVVLVNSNPASIMTDPDLADRTYIEPLTPEVVARVIEIERPDALLPTMGGQTALNLAVTLAENGTLERLGVELIGANLEAIRKAEDRLLFKEAMGRIGVNVCPSGIANNLEEAEAVGDAIGSYPRIIRPAFTLGGSGGGIAYNPEDFAAICKSGLEASPVSQILIEQSLLGWKEFELEVMRDTRRQRGDRLQHREPRPDGGAYGRFDHRGPGPDPHRPGISAAAGSIDRHHPGDRSGHRRQQHPVRHQPGRWGGGGD